MKEREEQGQYKVRSRAEKHQTETENDKQKKTKESKPKKKANIYQLTLLLTYDLLIVIFSYLLTSIIMSNFIVDRPDIIGVFNSLPFIIPIYVLSFFVFKLHKSLWRYASVDEAVKVIFSTTLAFGLVSLFNFILNLSIEFNEIFIANIFVFILLTGLRFSYRAIRQILIALKHSDNVSRTLIIGAGNAANLLIREIRNKITLIRGTYPDHTIVCGRIGVSASILIASGRDH